MELISKREMINQQWNTFERYPKCRSDIVLHVRGYQVRSNKYYHDFVRITSFNSQTFNPRKCTPKRQGVVWSYTWLPTSQLQANI